MNQDRSQIDRIKEASDIVTVIGKYINLKNTGQNYSGLCPFHNEKSPSFIVSPKIQRYKCFGCGKSGDVINFIEEIDSLEFIEAVEKLGKEAGIEFKKQEKSSPYQKLEDLNEIAAKFYYQQLSKPVGKEAVEYLRSRKFTGESAKKFLIGYAPGDGSLLKLVQSRKVYSTQELEDSGLFVIKNGILKEKFVKRVMFAISSVGGKVIGFSGRLLPGNDFGPKYLNTPETPIFKKRELLYGLNHCKNFIRKEDLAILVEGQPDVVKAFQFDIKNVVAPLGTSLTEQQAKVLKQYTENILLIFDSDSAGQKAVERAFEIFIPEGINLYVYNPTPFKDLDEMLDAKGIETLELLKEKNECFEYIIKSHIKILDLTTIEGKREIEKIFLHLISFVTHETYKNYCVEVFEKLTGIRSQVQQHIQGRASITTPINRPTIKKRNKEIYLLGLIIKYGVIPQTHIDESTINNESVKAIIQTIQSINSADSKLVLEALKDADAIELLQYIELNTDKIYVDKDYEIDIKNLYSKLREEALRHLLQKLRKELAIYEDDEIKSNEIAVKIQAILSELNTISK